MSAEARTFRFRTATVRATLVDYDKPHTIPERFRDQLCDCGHGMTTWPDRAHVHTPSGPIPVRDGDWLFEMEPGAFYTCNAALFYALVESVEATG